MAVGTTALIDASITDGIFAPDVWSTEVLYATEAQLRFAAAADRKFEKDASYGRTVKVASIGELAARTKGTSGNAAIAFERLTETVTTITLNQWVYAGFGLENFAALQSNIDLRSQYQKKIGYALAKKLDTDVATDVASFTQNLGTLGTNFTDDNLIRAIQYLEDANVPEDGRVIIITPAEHANLLKYDRFVSRDYTDGDPIKTGKVETLYGIPVLVSTNVYSAAASQSACTVMQKEALALVVQQEPKMHAFWDIDFLAWKIASDQIYGHTIMRDSFGVYLKGAK